MISDISNAQRMKKIKSLGFPALNVHSYLTVVYIALVLLAMETYVIMSGKPYAESNLFTGKTSSYLAAFYFSFQITFVQIYLLRMIRKIKHKRW